MFLYFCFRDEKMRYCRGGNLLKLVTQLVSGMAVVKPSQPAAVCRLTHYSLCSGQIRKTVYFGIT